MGLGVRVQGSGFKVFKGLWGSSSEASRLLPRLLRFSGFMGCRVWLLHRGLRLGSPVYPLPFVLVMGSRIK